MLHSNEEEEEEKVVVEEENFEDEENKNEVDSEEQEEDAEQNEHKTTVTIELKQRYGGGTPAHDFFSFTATVNEQLTTYHGARISAAYKAAIQRSYFFTPVINLPAVHLLSDSFAQDKCVFNLYKLDLPTKDQQIRFYCSLWLECCTAWVENYLDEFDKDVLAEAAATYEAKNKSPLCWPNSHCQLCCQHISGILQSFFSGLNELVDEFVAPILPKLVNGSPIHKAFLTLRQEQSSSLASLNSDDDDKNPDSKKQTPQ
ncbi:hypothetical protein QOT17_022131 [Balamuthia mandrillaris]